MSNNIRPSNSRRGRKPYARDPQLVPSSSSTPSNVCNLSPNEPSSGSSLQSNQSPSSSSQSTPPPPFACTPSTSSPSPLATPPTTSTVKNDSGICRPLRSNERMIDKTTSSVPSSAKCTPSPLYSNGSHDRNNNHNHNDNHMPSSSSPSSSTSSSDHISSSDTTPISPISLISLIPPQFSLSSISSIPSTSNNNTSSSSSSSSSQSPSSTSSPLYSNGSNDIDDNGSDRTELGSHSVGTASTQNSDLVSDKSNERRKKRKRENDEIDIINSDEHNVENPKQMKRRKVGYNNNNNTKSDQHDVDDDEDAESEDEEMLDDGNRNNNKRIKSKKSEYQYDIREHMVSNDNKKKSDDIDVDDDERLKYKIDYEYILSSCDGSCGNKLGRFVANIINGNEMLMSQQEKLDIISHKFGEYGNNMRAFFISLINNDRNNFSSIPSKTQMCQESICVNLQNEDVYISHNLAMDKKWIEIFTKSFKSLLKTDKSYILQKLVDKSCKRCNFELLEEIEENIKLNTMRKKKSKMKHRRNMKTPIDFDKCHEQIERVKNTEYYKKMKLSSKGLTNNEIIAIYLFVTNKSISNELKKYGNTCKWKQLYNNVCNAIRKIYQIFIFKNQKNEHFIPPKLYHFINGDCNEISKNHTKKSSNPWILPTINMVRIDENEDEDDDDDMNQSAGCLLSLVNIQNDLFNGQLIAAPIDWIINCDDKDGDDEKENKKDNHMLNSKQWLLLPTIFKITKFQSKKQNMSKWNLMMHEMQVVKNGDDNDDSKSNPDTSSLSSESCHN